jgi:hypothetical protein
VLQLPEEPAGRLKRSWKAARPAIFKGRQTEPVFILCAVIGICGIRSALRDVELLVERGWRRTYHHLALGSALPQIEQRLGRPQTTNKSWRVDETYVRVRVVIVRAIVQRRHHDFLLSALRDAVRPNDCSARRSATRRILNLVSSTQTKRQSTSRRFRQ